MFFLDIECFNDFVAVFGETEKMAFFNIQVIRIFLMIFLNEAMNKKEIRAIFFSRTYTTLAARGFYLSQCRLSIYGRVSSKDHAYEV